MSDSEDRANQLLEAYRRTTFFASTPECQLELRIGAGHSALDAILEDKRVSEWAYVTAAHPASVQLSADENRRRCLEFEAEIQKRGYRYFTGAGVPDDDSWPPEDSMLVLGISPTDAIQLAMQFGQLAIVWAGRGNRPTCALLSQQAIS